MKGDVKLLDLGLVLAGDDPLAVHDRLTTAGHFMGTMPFMSPEQLLDSRHVDPASDVYSLGATLYRLIAGRVPHANRHGLASQVLAITHETPTPLNEVVTGIDPELSSYVEHLLSRDPAQRPTAGDAAQTLKRWSGHANLVRLVNQASQKNDDDQREAVSWDSPLQVATMPPRRNWPRWLVAGLAAASVLIAGVIFKIQTQRGELVSESQADDVTVVVKQGDTMIDTLQIQQGDDNRVSLRQGTYTIEIAGAENGMRLEKDRVVIERGEQAKLSLQQSKETMIKVTEPDMFKVAEPAIEGSETATTLESALTIRPRYRSNADWPAIDRKRDRYTIQLVKTREYVGYEVLDERDTTLRLFVDTDDDRKLDRWCYFEDGLEVYREIDSNGNGVVDQALKIDPDGFIHWGLDTNENGEIETWVRPELRAGERVPGIRSTYRTRKSTVASSPRESLRTYQSHPYSYWLDILSREQDASTLSSAMRAVEILTRETPQRPEAAQATMKLSERLGGMVIGAGDNQSSTYMSALREVYPHYFPDPGLEFVVKALQSEDTESQMAASWVLSDFLNGMPNDTSSPMRIKSAQDYLRSLANGTAANQSRFHALLNALGQAFKADASVVSLEGVMNNKLLLSACKLIMIPDGSVEAPELIEAYIRQEVDKASQALATNPEGMGSNFNGLPAWWLSNDILSVAIELHRQDRLQLPVELVAAIVMHPRYSQYEHDLAAKIKVVADAYEHGADALRKTLRQRIERIVAGDWNDERSSMGGGFGGGGAGPDIHAILLKNENFWVAAFELLCDDNTTSTESLDVLKTFADAKVGITELLMVPEEFRPALDSAIAKLEKRGRSVFRGESALME